MAPSSARRQCEWSHPGNEWAGTKREHEPIMIEQQRLLCVAMTVLAACVALSCRTSENRPGSSPRELAITGATLIDGTGAPPRPGTTILVRDGRIAAVLTDADANMLPDVTVIDAAGKYVIPGLADMHVHLNLGTPLRRDDRTIETALARELYYALRRRGGSLQGS